MIISEEQIAFRLLVAALLGAAIGYERERADQPAGLRTHIMLVIGAMLAMVISINAASLTSVGNLRGDPTRIASQVLSGIGFLGGGAILKFGTNVRGLTTAASLWTTAVIGMTTGLGLYAAAILTTALAVLILSLVSRISRLYVKTYVSWIMDLTAENRPGLLDELEQTLHRYSLTLIKFSRSKETQDNLLKLKATIRVIETQSIEEILDSVLNLPGVKTVEMEQ